MWQGLNWVQPHVSQSGNISPSVTQLLTAGADLTCRENVEGGHSNGLPGDSDVLVKELLGKELGESKTWSFSTQGSSPETVQEGEEQYLACWNMTKNPVHAHVKFWEKSYVLLCLTQVVWRSWREKKKKANTKVQRPFISRNQTKVIKSSNNKQSCYYFCRLSYHLYKDYGIVTVILNMKNTSPYHWISYFPIKMALTLVKHGSAFSTNATAIKI